MKVFGIVMKVILALAAVAGAVYVAIVHGDKIVAWAKKTFKSLKCRCGGDCDCEGECTCDGECACDCDCECAEEIPEVPETAADEVVAAETDFEG